MHAPGTRCDSHGSGTAEAAAGAAAEGSRLEAGTRLATWQTSSRSGEAALGTRTAGAPRPSRRPATWSARAPGRRRAGGARRAAASPRAARAGWRLRTARDQGPGIGTPKPGHALLHSRSVRTAVQPGALGHSRRPGAGRAAAEAAQVADTCWLPNGRRAARPAGRQICTFVAQQSVAAFPTRAQNWQCLEGSGLS